MPVERFIPIYGWKRAKRLPIPEDDYEYSVIWPRAKVEFNGYEDHRFVEIAVLPREDGPTFDKQVNPIGMGVVSW